MYTCFKRLSAAPSRNMSTARMASSSVMPRTSHSVSTARGAKAAALAEGRGEVLTPLPPLPRVPVVICMPHFTCSTPELFARLDSLRTRCRPDTNGLVSALRVGDLCGVARRMYNVFEDALDRRPAQAVGEIKRLLLEGGALGAVMSGSGSAVYGVFDDEERATDAARSAKNVCREVFLTSTV